MSGGEMRGDRRVTYSTYYLPDTDAVEFAQFRTIAQASILPRVKWTPVNPTSESVIGADRGHIQSIGLRHCWVVMCSS